MDATTARGRSRTERRPIRKRRTQAERSATTRSELINAAAACLSKQGYVQATVDVVAKAAGVSRGAVQHHFGSRDQLLLAVVEDLGRELAQAEAISRDLSIEDQINAAIDRDWKVFRSNQFIAVIEIWLSSRHDQKLFNTVRKTVGELEMSLDKRWQELFAEIDVDPKAVATIRHIVLSTLRGLALRNIFRQQQSSWADEIAALKQMTINALLV